MSYLALQYGYCSNCEQIMDELIHCSNLPCCNNQYCEECSTQFLSQCDLCHSFYCYDCDEYADEFEICSCGIKYYGYCGDDRCDICYKSA
jgi:hypothetical protein